MRKFIATLFQKNSILLLAGANIQWRSFRFVEKNTNMKQLRLFKIA